MVCYFMLLHDVYMGTTQTLTRLHNRAGSLEPLLLIFSIV